jgi:High-temperature-induced dauer-formation protein
MLPLLVLLTLSNTLGPTLEEYCTINELNDEKKVLDFVTQFTLVGQLPQPHPITICLFKYSDQMHLWFTSYLWVSDFLTAGYCILGFK